MRSEYGEYLFSFLLYLLMAFVTMSLTWLLWHWYNLHSLIRRTSGTTFSFGLTIFRLMDWTNFGVVSEHFQACPPGNRHVYIVLDPNKLAPCGVDNPKRTHWTC
jgi:hypothetical protein